MTPDEHWPLPVPANVAAVTANEDVTFKLAIRGYTALEEIITEGICEAIPAGVLEEITGPRAYAKLALAQALGIITSETRVLIDKLRVIRNDFAHGKIDEIPIERARELLGPIRAVLGGEPVAGEGLPEISAHQWLLIALTIAAWAAEATIRVAAAERAARDAALENIVRRSPIESALAELFAHAAEKGSELEQGSASD